MTDHTGQTIDGRYRVEELLGRGGMGKVYAGRHIVVGKKVAIKFLHPELASNAEVVKRFYREAQAAAAIDHRSIIDVIDVGVCEVGKPYLVMEYLEGESLSSVLVRSAPIDLAAACGVMDPALAALSVAHTKGMVHRDLKPENIFLVHQTRGEPLIKLIDFGISKFTHITGRSKLTQTGSFLGTPAYMAPEQAQGAESVDHRSDLYAMGVIMYEMLTGGLPFIGNNYNALLLNMLANDPRPPSEVNPDFPAEAEGFVFKALAKDPDDRHQSAIEMLDELETLKAFGSRREELTRLGSSMHTKDVAWGDIGSEINTDGSEDRLAADIYSEMADNQTPRTWNQTTAGSAVSRKGLLWAVIGIGVAVVAIGVYVLFINNRGPASPSPPAASAVGLPPAAATRVSTSAPVVPVSEDQTVSIELEDVPEGATIYYNQAPVPMNPFKVKKGAGLIVIKVAAKGFEPFVTSLVPDRDKSVPITLAPLKPAEEKPSSATDRKERRSRSRKERRSPRKALSKGKRNTRFADDFE